MSTDAEYNVKKIKEKLTGGIITGSLRDDENFGFVVTNRGKTYIVWVDQDAEGNGCGWLSIREEE